MKCVITPCEGFIHNQGLIYCMEEIPGSPRFIRMSIGVIGGCHRWMAIVAQVKALGC